MSYEIRLDEFGTSDNDGRGSGYSTVIIAQIGEQSIHWGTASLRGETHQIVTVKLGFLSVTIDDHLVGADKLRALHNAYHFKAVEKRKEQSTQTTATNRFDAAIAAVAANNYAVSCEIDPVVLFNMVVVLVLKTLAQHITPEHIAGILKAAESAGAEQRRQGVEDAKRELRTWLAGAMGSGSVWS